jgi:hypothetical protein
MQFVNALSPLFIFPTFRVCSAAEGFLFYRVDLLLNELTQFSSDTQQIAFHNAHPPGEEFYKVSLDSRRR